MLLQLYEDGTFGYKGIDNCKNKFLLEQINHGEVLFEQNEDENREDFFKRANKVPEKNEYGSDEKLDEKVNSKYWDSRADVAYQGYGLEKLMTDKDWKVRSVVTQIAGALGKEDILKKLINDKDERVRRTVQCYI